MWPDGQIIWIFLSIYDTEIFPNYKQIAIEVSKFCPIQNKPLYKCPRLFKCSQSGEISPNMVSLHWTHHLINPLKAKNELSFLFQDAFALLTCQRKTRQAKLLILKINNFEWWPPILRLCLGIGRIKVGLKYGFILHHWHSFFNLKRLNYKPTTHCPHSWTQLDQIDISLWNRIIACSSYLGRWCQSFNNICPKCVFYLFLNCKSVIFLSTNSISLVGSQWHQMQLIATSLNELLVIVLPTLQFLIIRLCLVSINHILMICSRLPSSAEKEKFSFLQQHNRQLHATGPNAASGLSEPNRADLTLTCLEMFSTLK